MGGSPRAIAGALAVILGPGRWGEGRADAPDGVDGAVPGWVARPATTEQVAQVVTLAVDAGLVVVPHGSGAAQALGHPVERADVVLDLRGLDRVVEWSPEDLTVSVEAGVTLGTLGATLGTRRQLLPLDPPASGGRTLGGVTATNASGPLRARYGTMRDLLLGVRFVQADGVVTWGGARVVKSVTGYDVPKLMIGALGTLGVLTELTLRLQPAPEHEQTWVATFEDREGAQALVDAVGASTLQPNRVQWLGAAALARLGLGPAAAGVAVCVGSLEEAVRSQGERLGALARAAGGRFTPAAAGLWAARGALGPGPGGVGLRIATMPAAVSVAAGEVEAAAAALAPGADVTLAGCAASGVLDVAIDGIAPATGQALVERLRGALGPGGASVVVTAGPRELRARIDPWGPVEPGALALMRGLKAEFDPRGVLNPGRFVGGL